MVGVESMPQLLIAFAITFPCHQVEVKFTVMVLVPWPETIVAPGAASFVLGSTMVHA